jgi:hypothetical protein
MAIESWDSGNIQVDTLTFGGASLTSLANSGYSISGQVDNSNGSATGVFTTGEFAFFLPSAVTAGTGAPNISVVVLFSEDASNWPAPPATALATAPTTGAATGVPASGTINAVASASFLGGNTQPFLLRPFKLIVQVQNQLGVAFPSSGTFSAKLYRYNLKIV